MPITTAFHKLADRLDIRPNRPADIHTIRGHARTLGLTGDLLDLLPATNGATHSQYAARLRHLAGSTH